MKIKKFVKKYYNKALAVGSTISGIILLDKTVKATRKIGKYKPGKLSRIAAESTIQVAGVMALMSLGSYLWDMNENDTAELTDEQLLALIRSRIVDSLTSIKRMLEDPDRDMGDLVETIYDVTEAYESGRLVPNEYDTINKIHKYILANDTTTATQELNGMIGRVATGVMSIIPDEDNEPHAVKGMETREYLDRVIKSAEDDLKAGKVSAIDAMATVIDAMEANGIDDDDLVQKVTDHFADIEESKKSTTASEQP